MERKDFITSFFKTAAGKKDAPQKKQELNIDGITDIITPIPGGLDPYSGPWTDNEVTHLLRRTTFGAPVEEINYFKTLTYTQAVDTLLNTVNDEAAMGVPLKVVTTEPSPPSSDPDWSVPLGRTWVNTITMSRDVNKDRRDSLKSWWLNIMVKQPRSVEEKMILFWSNHVTIEFAMVGNALMDYKYLQLLRQYALGNFKTLIKLVSLDPGMLVYLNGYQNSKAAPDENYARELQELFTLGKGPESLYTEDDVKAAARVLTGYQVDLFAGITSFNINRHDTNPKQFSSFYGNTVINRSPAEGHLELDDMVDMIFAKDEVSKFICRKLYRYFVYHDITPEIETAIIEPLAETFRNNNYEIKPVLEKLFKKQSFF